MRGDGSIRQPRLRRIAQPLTRRLDGVPDAVRAGLQDLLACDLLARLDEASRGTVEIVLAEVLNNIVEHAYAQYPGIIDLSITPREGFLFVRLVDHGLPMPNGELPAGALRDPLAMDDLPEGGFGWYLIRSLTEELAYARVADQNVLSFCVNVDYQA